MPYFGTRSLFELPAEILVQHILSRLTLSSLVACSLTCKDLHNIINSESSILLIYIKELGVAGMIDNEDCPYHIISLRDRLEALRERETRWTALDWKWRKTGIDLPFNALEDMTQHTPSGVVVMHPIYEEDVSVIYSATMPSTEADSVHWAELNLDKVMLQFSPSMEQDLLICITATPDSYVPSLHVRSIHFIQNSTGRSHPLASSSKLCPSSIHGRTEPARSTICGRNLAINNAQEGLTIYDWKRGIETARIALPEGTLDADFLREDLFVSPSTSRMSLDIFHIPTPDTTTKQTVTPHIVPFVSLGLPPIDHTRYEAISIEFGEVPIPTTRVALSTRPFHSDPLSAIQIIRMKFRSKYRDASEDDSEDEDEPSHIFVCVTHTQTLIETALNVEKSQQPTTSPLPMVIPWDSWGPHATRIFPQHPPSAEVSDAGVGTKYAVLGHGKLAVMDFGKYKVARQAQIGKTAPLKAFEGVQIELFDAERPSIIDPIEDNPFVELVLTYLPYVSSSRIVPCGTVMSGHDGVVGDGDGSNIDDTWESVFMDEARIFGHVEIGEIEKLDMLYFG